MGLPHWMIKKGALLHSIVIPIPRLRSSQPADDLRPWGSAFYLPLIWRLGLQPTHAWVIEKVGRMKLWGTESGEDSRIGSICNEMGCPRVVSSDGSEPFRYAESHTFEGLDTLASSVHCVECKKTILLNILSIPTPDAFPTTSSHLKTLVKIPQRTTYGQPPQGLMTNKAGLVP